MFLGYQNNKIKFYTEQQLDQVMYNLDKVEETELEYVLVNDEYVLKTDSKAIEQAKEAKVQANDVARDEALLQGVVYKDVLFDSDTDQKINLLAIVSTMGDEDTITWFGMDNVPLECTKEDLINIGGLITALHSFCWNKNAEIKLAIQEAETIEEVEAIEIDYIQEEEDEPDTENQVIEQAE